MYKLLTTAAVIMTVATPSIAWDGAADLTKNLNAIYNGVDGSGHFGQLQGNGGELNTFVGNATAGVTHISLRVSDGTDGNDPNTIQTELNEGKTLAEIQDSANNLVNRINYDLFHDSDITTFNDTVTGNYDSKTDYTIVRTDTDSLIGHNVTTGGAAATADGLVGFKVNKIVTAANTINTALVNAPGTTEAEIAAAAAANSAFIDAYNGVDGATAEHFGVNVPDFLGDITEINGSITAANGSGGEYFANTSTFSIDGASAGNFAIEGFVSDVDGVLITDGASTYTSILDWANAQPVAP